MFQDVSKTGLAHFSQGFCASSNTFTQLLSQLTLLLSTYIISLFRSWVQLEYS